MDSESESQETSRGEGPGPFQQDVNKSESSDDPIAELAPGQGPPETSPRKVLVRLTLALALLLALLALAIWWFLSRFGGYFQQA